MPRAFFGARKSLLLLAVIAAGSGAVWWMRPAADPMIGGRRFSEWAGTPFMQERVTRGLDDVNWPPGMPSREQGAGSPGGRGEETGMPVPIPGLPPARERDDDYLPPDPPDEADPANVVAQDNPVDSPADTPGREQGAGSPRGLEDVDVPASTPDTPVGGDQGNVLVDRSPVVLQATTPAEIKWLAYTVEHGRHPFIRTRALPFDGAPDWLRRYVPESWGGRRAGVQADERAVAARLLSLLGADAAAAIPALVRVMNFAEDSPEAASSATMALLAIGPAAWPEIDKGLKQSQASVRARIVSNLHMRMLFADWPHSDAELTWSVGALNTACRDADSAARVEAIEAIQDILQKSDDEGMRQRLEATIPAMLSQPQPGSLAGQVQETLSLFRKKGAPMMPVYAGILEGDDPTLHRFAARELQEMGPGTWPVVERLLREAKPEGRYAVMEAVVWRLKREKGKVVDAGDAAWVCATLIGGLGDPDPQMRALAAVGIAWKRFFPEDGAAFGVTIPHLIPLLADADVRVYSEYALHNERPTPDSSVKLVAIKALAEFGPKAVAAVPALIERLDDGNAEIRREAATALGKIDREEKRSAERLRKMLEDRDGACRKIAAKSLEFFGLKAEK